MDEKDIPITEDKADKLLDAQLNFYHGLQTKAQQLIKLIVGTLATVVTFLSLVLTGVIELNVGINSPAYYINQTAVNSGSEEVVSVVVALYWVFIITLTISILASISGIINILKVFSLSGFHPFITEDLGVDTEIVRGNKYNSYSTTDSVIKNNKILSKMDSKLKEGYKYLGVSLITFLYASFLFIAAYFADLEFAGNLSVAVVTILIAVSYFKLRSNLGYELSNISKDRIDKVDRYHSIAENFLLTLIIIVLLIIPLIYIGVIAIGLETYAYIVIGTIVFAVITDLGLRYYLQNGE